MNDYLMGLNAALHIVNQEMAIAKTYKQPLLRLGMLQVKEQLEIKIMQEESKND